MSVESDALLAALGARALAKRAVRGEMHSNAINQLEVPMDQLDSWAALKRAEQAVNDTLMAWEMSEGLYN